MKKATLAILAASSLCAACSSIYVGNVKFSETEVCSEEYSTRLPFVYTGCLPPAPVANAQSYMFQRFRLPITENEQKNIEETIKSGQYSSGENLLPNILGRVFVATEKGGEVIVPDAGGQITFLPGEMDCLPTELVKMDMTGAAKKKISASTEIDMAALINQAAAVANITSLSSTTKNQLAASLSFSKESMDTSSGSYYYISIEPQALAKLAEKLWVKSYMAEQAPERGRAEGIWLGNGSYKESISASGIPAISYDAADQTFTVQAECLDNAQHGCSSLAKGKVFGVVIGAAIIHTKSGSSASCTRNDFALLGTASSVSPTCLQLENTIQGAVSSVVATELPKNEDAAKLPYFIKSLQLGYASATLKTQDVGNHASLLAIKWLPIRQNSK